MQPGVYPWVHTTDHSTVHNMCRPQNSTQCSKTQHHRDRHVLQPHQGMCRWPRALPTAHWSATPAVTYTQRPLSSDANHPLIPRRRTFGAGPKNSMKKPMCPPTPAICHTSSERGQHAPLAAPPWALPAPHLHTATLTCSPNSTPHRVHTAHSSVHTPQSTTTRRPHTLLPVPFTLTLPGRHQRRPQPCAPPCAHSCARWRRRGAGPRSPPGLLEARQPRGHGPWRRFLPGRLPAAPPQRW